LLHHDVYAEYSSENPRFLTAGLAAVPNSPPQSGNGTPRREFLVPLEFTHGAFRFGHAMVRDEYRMNARENSVFAIDEALRHNSLFRPSEMPLNRRWIVEWSRFFELPSGSGPPQYSHRIGPHLSGGLNHETLFHEIDFTGRQGIAYRDLMSAAFVRLWSVNALIEEIRAKRSDLVAKSPLLRDQAHRSERLHAWLKVDQSLSGLTNNQITALADDPPLPFFIQYEAANESDAPADRGQRLGILGSIIVAEVIFGAFAGDPLPIESLRRSLADAKSRHPQSSFAADCLGEVEGIASMAQLVEFTAKVANLTSADPAFL
jgi:hypothetical protein